MRFGRSRRPVAQQRGYRMIAMTMTMWEQECRRAQREEPPRIQPRDALRAGHREEARRKAKTTIMDSNNATIQKHKLC